jgi:GNAT superfamily N-acetyltransferase
MASKRCKRTSSEKGIAMRAQEFITEAFNQPYATDLEKSEHDDYDSLVQLPDGSHLSVMFNNQGDGEYQVEFWRGPSQGVTGEGDAQRIFATVLSTIQRFIKEHNPWRLTFSATKDVEPGQNSESRAKLYNRLVDRYAAAWGYDAYNEDHGDQVEYELTRLKPNVAEGFPNFNREWDEATRYPEFVNLGKKKWIELVSKGKPVTVTRKNVNKINNTDAADPNSFKLLDPEKQKRALAQLANGDVEMPIVARYSDGYLELIGGNTRLTAQMAKDGQAKVWLFNVPEELTQGMAEGRENVEHFNGLDFSIEIEKDDEYVDDDDTDNQTIYVKAFANGRELGHVLFTIDYDGQGMILKPQDLEVDERFQGQGIAAAMYDYVKSKGYKIRRSGQQTDAGAGFWGKHRPEQNVWEDADNGAVEELRAALVTKRDQLQSATDDEVYDIIDRIMTRIARNHGISGKKLHDMWVDTYKQVPDTWIMKENFADGQVKGQRTKGDR